MKLKKTTVGALCVAAAIAVGGAQWFAVNTASSAAEPVVRAKVEIPSGTKITVSMLETVEMGRLGLPSNITSNAAQVAGTYAKTDIQPHDIITGGKLSGHAPGATLLDGKMLYSVAVKNLADSVSGKLQSGDIVQVVVPAQTTGNNAVGTSSNTLDVLQYVEVEGVTASNGQDAKAASSSASTTGNQPATVTLVVSQAQVNALASLGQNEISFALVSRGDESKAKELLAKQDALLGGQQ
ncbi:MAG: RcpC/CpaB family pilus assembly protein [Ethanoligenens sp.]